MPYRTENAEQALKEALTVQELRDALEEFDDDCKVMFTIDYGDHAHTAQALPIVEVTEVESGRIVDTGYSASRAQLLTDEDWDDDDEQPALDEHNVVILSMHAL